MAQCSVGTLNQYVKMLLQQAKVRSHQGDFIDEDPPQFHHIHAYVDSLLPMEHYKSIEKALNGHCPPAAATCFIHFHPSAPYVCTPLSSRLAFSATCNLAARSWMELEVLIRCPPGKNGAPQTDLAHEGHYDPFSGGMRYLPPNAHRDRVRDGARVWQRLRGDAANMNTAAYSPAGQVRHPSWPMEAHFIPCPQAVPPLSASPRRRHLMLLC